MTPEIIYTLQLIDIFSIVLCNVLSWSILKIFQQNVCVCAERIDQLLQNICCQMMFPIKEPSQIHFVVDIQPREKNKNNNGQRNMRRFSYRPRCLEAL